MIFILEKSQEQGRVKRFLGFTTYSIRGEKTFFKKINNLADFYFGGSIQLQQTGSLLLHGYLSEEILVIQYGIWRPDNSKERHSKKQLLLET